MEDGTLMSLGYTRVSCNVEVGSTHACELRDLLDRLADKWSLLVVELLGQSTYRFSDLRRQIDGISQRMLTLTLRQLERDGLVHRTVYPVVPPRVEYRLTPLGETLLEAIQPLVAWARAHRDEIADARTRYDRDLPPAGGDHGTRFGGVARSNA
jgi:DNA-binding HxlR family transcriptional regulator